MLFGIPLPPDDDPADAWKKADDDASKGHGTLPAANTGWKSMPMPVALAEDISNRFAELGFSPEMVRDMNAFQFLFLQGKNCLLIKTTKTEAEGRTVAYAHYFLERKIK